MEDANSDMVISLPDSIQNFLENGNQSSNFHIRDHTAQFGSVAADNMLFTAGDCSENSNQSTVFECIDTTERFGNQNQAHHAPSIQGEIYQ